MSIKVSVVVPVYNPGRYLDDLLRSLERQSMPANEFEVIFVDDGSTDGTATRLDELAAGAPNVRTIHIPPSGWPGRPRNVGIDAARGTYVQFVDHDDELGDEALARMYAYAEANGSDVVVGKEARRNKPFRTGPLFERNRPKATLADDPPLVLLLTPHKMFRRAFLVQHGIRFLEGPRRLDDHAFVMTAYFRAEVVSVLADYTCYYWHRRHGSAGRQQQDWSLYYTGMRDTLDVVQAHTEPGPLRDRLLSHWYRRKGLRRLGPGFAAHTEDDARALFDALRDLTLERFPPHLDGPLRGVMRVRAGLLRRGDFEGLRHLCATEKKMDLSQRMEDISRHDGALHLTVAVSLSYTDGTPVVVEEEAGRRFWRLPVPVDIDARSDLLDFTTDSRDTKLTVYVRRRGDDQMFALPGKCRPLVKDADGLVRLGARSTVTLDPARARDGRPMQRGTWDLGVELRSCGWQVRRGLRCLEFAETFAAPAVTVTGGRATTDRLLWLRRAVSTGRRKRGLG